MLLIFLAGIPAYIELDSTIVFSKITLPAAIIEFEFIMALSITMPPIPIKTKGDHIFLATQYKYLYPLGSNKKIANGTNSNITGKADRA